MQNARLRLFANRRRKRNNIVFHRLSLSEAKALLSAGRTGHLGCITERGPYVVPVNYILDGDHIYIHSAMGSKIRALRQNPLACLQVEEVTSAYQWRSAIAFGSYEEVQAEDERAQVLEKILLCFPHLTPVESNLDSQKPEATILFRIRITEITGVEERLPSPTPQTSKKWTGLDA